MTSGEECDISMADVTDIFHVPERTVEMIVLCMTPLFMYVHKIRKHVFDFLI